MGFWENLSTILPTNPLTVPIITTEITVIVARSIVSAELDRLLQPQREATARSIENSHSNRSLYR